ncbi:hypothetical protein QTL97_03100 [Sporosarcina thermotolerans]|uniref:Uncharacterized protein n=1 Tax=Sporosarcina thermotolerans TaxID=633404 RepID=A0AAW9A505_9BACL|nr:hypothetical protein [Sporosarcina thermotolerans]MDW0115929.1 hypothetical protein [Sporosarcina thermotolerans]
MNDKHVNSTDTSSKNKYLEILGDTIVPNQLLFSIVISVAVSLGGYNLGLWFFPSIASENMVASYSLLLGITGTVLSLVLCSFVFKPKRILIEEETSTNSMREVFEDLQLDADEELALIENDPITKKELEELGVLEQFRALGGDKKK